MAGVAFGGAFPLILASRRAECAAGP